MKGIITPTINQERVASIVLDQIRKGEKVSVSKAMRAVGYSEWYSHHPEKITTSKAWQMLMAKYLSDDLLTATHLELLFDKNWKARQSALDMAYKLKKKYGTGDSGGFAGASIKNLLIQIYNDKRPLINKENANPDRSGIRETVGKEPIRPKMAIEQPLLDQE